MSDETTTTDSNTNSNEQVTPSVNEQPAQVEANKLEDLPKYWQGEVRELRREGQNKGARINELTAELENARSAASQREADLNAEVEKVRMESVRFRAVVEAGIPLDRAQDIASRLRGETEDELRADAASFGDLFKSHAESRRGVDPSQGAGNGSGAPATVAQQLSSQISALRGH